MESTLKRLLLILGALLALSACGQTTAECPSENKTCGGRCTAILEDAANCGGCGNSCAAGFACVEGACVCGTGQVECNGACTTLENDNANCGACGTLCTGGSVCIDGSCQAGACTGSLCDVNGTELCVDTDTDEANCGGCGIACGNAQQCLGGTCAAGDLYVSCFTDGSVIPFVKATNTKSSPVASGFDGPQSLALLDQKHFLVLGSMDQTLYVIARATMQQVGSIVVGTAPNQVVVRGTRAYVLNSAINTVQVVELADPTAPTTVDEVSTGDGTNPMGAAFDDQGTLWVSLWLTGEVLPIDFSGATGVKGTAVALPEVEGTRYPAGVAAIGNTVYVTLNNLDANFAPAGNGRVATVDRTSKATALVDLGATCKNAGFTANTDTELWITCADSYFEGEVAVLDTTSNTVTRRYPTGGGPSRISLDTSRPGVAYVADGASTNVIALQPDGSFDPVAACPAPGEGGFEFTSDVLVVP